MSQPEIYWQKKKLESCEENGDTGKVWKNILGWLNWSSSSTPTRLLSQGNLETSPSRMADIQNKYYIETIRKSLQEKNRDPLEILRKILNSNQASFSAQSITAYKVDKIIRKLKNSKASGMDNLDTYIIRLARQEIVPSVCHI